MFWQYQTNLSVHIGEAANGRAAIQNMTISEMLTGQRLKRKEKNKMISKILGKVAELLDWTNDAFEAGIIRIIAEAIGAFEE